MSDFQEWSRTVAGKWSARSKAAASTDTSHGAARRHALCHPGRRQTGAADAGHAAGLVSIGAERVKIVSAAVEIIHAYSLAHDDLPCMDDDVLRRGKPTCHVEFDEATALLAGDALQALAFELMAATLDGRPARQLEMLRIFARACGSRGMAGGQAIDLANVGQQSPCPNWNTCIFSRPAR